MMTATVPVKLNPANLYGPDEFQEGINIAIQSGIVYVVIKTNGLVTVYRTNVYQEDL